MSVAGVAREAAAITATSLKFEYIAASPVEIATACR